MSEQVNERSGAYERVLVTGVSGRLGKMVARRLAAAGVEVLGVDRRPWPDAPDGVEMYNADIRKRPAEDVFRTKRPQAVVHMATVSHVSARPGEQYRTNLKGTQAIFNHAHTYGAEQVIFVGRHTYYGAAPDSPLYHGEDDPPLSIAQYPELADLVAADLYAGSSLWRYPELSTAVLRICYTLGPSHHGTLASFLRGPRVPTVLGFDPLYQFMHEEDVARAIVATLTAKAKGVFNVAGPQPVPLSLLIEVTGRQQLALPEPLLRRMLGRFGLPKLEPGAIHHLKYPIVIDGSAFRAATGFEHQYDEVRTMEAFRWSER